jgi:hypothetical protein
MYNEKQIQEALDIYNKERQDIIDREKAELVRPLILSIKSQRDRLPGIQFSTGNLDDMYQIKEVEDEETLVLFQTWEGESAEGEEMEITELSFDQMKEIFLELDRNR